MKLLRKITGRSARRRPAGLPFRTCRIEAMEPRLLLAFEVPPIHVGAVYFEDGSGHDEVGDLIEITFAGGVPGTQLVQIAIQTDKYGDGLSLGDVFFDTQSGGLGAYAPGAPVVIDQAGIDAVNFQVLDGGTLLVIQFAGFDAGEKLVFSIDVDEMGALGPNAVAEGNEFEVSQLTATFVAPHFYDAQGSDIFLDYYDFKLAPTGLLLPADDYDPPSPYMPPSAEPGPIYTAGAVASVIQQPLPITIAGTVFEDIDLDNFQQPGEPGIAGVTLELYRLESSGYEPTGLSTITDAVGNYLFEAVLPGTYRIVEVQPAGYYSVGARAGKVGEATRGLAASPDVIEQVSLVGGEQSVENDFAEARPAALSGHVFHDANDNGLFDASESGIGGVTVQVERLAGGPFPGTTISVITAPDGSWSIAELHPGEYRVRELQPSGYFDGQDRAGTAGGVAHNPGDLIDQFHLLSGQSGTDYDFGELLPASLSGRVFVDVNENGMFDPGEPLLGGVTIILLDVARTPIASTQTNAAGEYRFANLVPGTYGVEEVQPAGYLQGQTHPGSAGGWLDSPDRIVGAKLGAGVDAVEYNFCEIVPATISGYVFQDGPPITVAHGQPVPQIHKVRDGKFTPDDTPIAGVLLYLGDQTGAPILDGSGLPLTAMTDASGYYQFTMLRPGVYTILEVQPAGYVDGLDTPGSLGGIALNPHEPMDAAALAALAALVVDPQDDGIIQISLPMGQTGVEYNFSEVVIQELPPPPSPPILPPPPPPPPSFLPPLPLSAPRPPGVPPAVVHLPLGSPAPVGVPVAPNSPRPGLSIPGGGGVTGDYTWHLSIIDAGQPRGRRPLPSAQFALPTDFSLAAWGQMDLGQAQWITLGTGQAFETIRFGLPGAVPLSGDFNGDGKDEVAVYVAGQWFIDLNGNGLWDEGDLWAQLGGADDLPVVGDWDGDGKTDIGIFGPAWPGDYRAIAAEPGLPDAENLPAPRPKNLPPEPQHATDGRRVLKSGRNGIVRADLIDHVFQYGTGGDKPVAGDFNGDGVTTIGVFREGTWILDRDGDGRLSANDTSFQYGTPGDRPVVGDFDGDGVDEVGVYRAGAWYADIDRNRQLDAHDKLFELGGAGDLPVAADFDGDGADEPAVYRAPTPAD